MKLMYEDITVTIKTFPPDGQIFNINFNKIFTIDKNKDSIKIIIEKFDSSYKTKRVLIYSSGDYIPLDINHILHIDRYIVFCSGKYVYKWNIYSDNLEWSIELDDSFCFSLILFNKNLNILVAGESQLSAINLNGRILWTYIGSDIFVKRFGESGAYTDDDRIYIIDWNGITHILDFEGKLLEYYS